MPSDERIDGSVRRVLEDRAAGGAFPGAVWWVEEAGSVLSRGAVGDSALEPSLEPAFEDTVYDLASLTKPLATALLAVLLEREGELDLDEPVSRFVPECSGSPYAPVPLLELGRHRSGLPAWDPLYLEGGGREGYSRAIAALPPANRAGTELYSDLGYLLLGFAVETVAGAGLDVLFRERIADPLGLPTCSFLVAGAGGGTVAPTERGNRFEREMAGSRGEDHPWREEIIRGEVHDANAHGLGGVAGHAGLFGAANEVAAICREILRPGVLDLPPASTARLIVSGDDEAARTFGLVRASGSRAASGALPGRAVGHTGFTGTSLWLEPGRERSWILLTNRVHPEVDANLDFQQVRLEFHRAATGGP